MCAPQNTSTDSAAGLDTKYPCNEVLNITYTCVYNLTAEEQPSDGADGLLIENDAVSQQKCLCPGGAGAALWENVEA